MGYCSKGMEKKSYQFQIDLLVFNSGKSKLWCVHVKEKLENFIFKNGHEA